MKIPSTTLMYCKADIDQTFCYYDVLVLLSEGGVRGVRKPQNRTEIRQKTANRIGFFPEYRNRAYM